MEKDKIKVFLKSLPKVIFTSLVAGIVIGVLATVLTLYIKDFFTELISNVAFGTGILAIATITLALFTYWNIHSHNAQEKRDRKERWLNEIIEWSVDIKKCLYSTEAIGKPQKNLYAITHLNIATAIAKRKKIETIAQRVFGDDLFKYVENVEGSVTQFSAGIRFAVGLDEGPLLNPEIREKIKQARKQGWKEIDAILNKNFQQPVVATTTDLIEKCSQLIADL
jgi:hypothetical protein